MSKTREFKRKRAKLSWVFTNCLYCESSLTCWTLDKKLPAPLRDGDRAALEQLGYLVVKPSEAANGTRTALVSVVCCGCVGRPIAWVEVLVDGSKFRTTRPVNLDATVLKRCFAISVDCVHEAARLQSRLPERIRPEEAFERLCEELPVDLHG